MTNSIGKCSYILEMLSYLEGNVMVSINYSKMLPQKHTFTKHIKQTVNIFLNHSNPKGST